MQNDATKLGVNRQWVWAGLAVLLEAAFIALVRLPQGAGSSLLRCLLWLSAAGIVYLIAVLLTLHPARMGLPGFRLIFWAAVIFRLTLLPLTPQLTHASLRSQWEGKAQHFGFNPYPYPPSNSLFNPLQPPAALPAPHIAAWRPPFAELLLRWTYDLFHGLRAEKIVWIAFDLLLILLLVRLLRARNRPPAWVLFYAWSPLAVFEISGNGHMVSAAAFLLLLALDWALRRPRTAAAVAAAASLAAWYALVSVPLVLASAGRRIKGAVAWLVVVGALLWLPYLFFNRHVIFPALWHNLRLHLAAPVFNASLFALLESWFSRPVAWAVAAAVVAAALIAVLRRRGGEYEPLRAAFVVIGALLLVLPQVHPAQALWILPFVALFPEPAWIYFSLAAVWGYAVGHSLIWTWLEYAPLYVLLAWQLRSRQAAVQADPSAAGVQ